MYFGIVSVLFRDDNNRGEERRAEEGSGSRMGSRGKGGEGGVESRGGDENRILDNIRV